MLYVSDFCIEERREAAGFFLYVENDTAKAYYKESYQYPVYDLGHFLFLHKRHFSFACIVVLYRRRFHIAFTIRCADDGLRCRSSHRRDTRRFLHDSLLLCFRPCFCRRLYAYTLLFVNLVEIIQQPFYLKRLAMQFGKLFILVVAILLVDIHSPHLAIFLVYQILDCVLGNKNKLVVTRNHIFLASSYIYALSWLIPLQLQCSEALYLHNTVIDYALVKNIDKRPDKRVNFSSVASGTRCNVSKQLLY